MQEDNSSSMDKELEALNARMHKMDKKQEKLFEALGISPHQLHHFMNDPERFATPSKERIEAQSRELEAILDRRIEETKKPADATLSPLDQNRGGHWVFIR